MSVDAREGARRTGLADTHLRVDDRGHDIPSRHRLQIELPVSDTVWASVPRRLDRCGPRRPHDR